MRIADSTCPGGSSLRASRGGVGRASSRAAVADLAEGWGERPREPPSPILQIHSVHEINETMCGRYSITGDPRHIGTRLGMPSLVIPPRYNVAPTQLAPVILQEQAENPRELKSLRWGLIPFWAKEESIGNRMINARAESVVGKPAFKRPFTRQRCLVLADGFYEWQKSGSVKQPYRVTLQSGDLFAFAGLWDRWKKPDGESLQTFTIITTEANDLTRKLHDRMPVIVSPDDYETWLDPAIHDANALQNFLRPYPPDEMTCYPVSRMVNNPKNEDPRCIEPLSE